MRFALIFTLLAAAIAARSEAAQSALGGRAMKAVV